VKIGNTPPFALNLQSEVNGNDERSLYQLGSESIELIEVNGQHYVKGARSLGVPSASKWYSITPDLADAVRFPFSPQEILAAVAGTGLKQNFLASARESLDAMNCSVWSYAPKSLADLGVASALGLDASVSAFESVDQSEIKLWVCDDGAVHQLSIEIAAHKTSNAAEKGSLKLQIHAWDFGSAIKIAAPAGAEPFQLGAPKP
jgi:hypothetical protein